MGCFIVGVRAGACGSSASGAERSGLLRGRSPWFVLLVAATGCTLTTDPFDPSVVTPTRGESDSVESGLLPGAPVLPGGDDPGGAPTPSGGLEETDPSVPLDPASTGGGQLGAASSEDGTESSGRSDAGVEVADATAAARPDAGAPPAPEPCPGLGYEGSCYAFFVEALPWVEAEARCVAWNGHLASVASPEEDAFLNVWPAMLGFPPFNGFGIWLGGTDVAGNAFAWSDATPFAFTAWGPNQPDNGFGVDCIEKRNDGTARWYDQRCTDQLSFVCERAL